MIGKITRIGLTLVAFLLSDLTFGQVKVGDNPTQINTNAIIEFESANKGVLLPRIALTSTSSSSPMSAFVAGMVVYNTATAGDVVPGFYVSNGSNWSRIDNQSATTIYSGDGTLTSARTINMGSNGLFFQGAGEIYKYSGSSSARASINIGRTGGEGHFTVAASNGQGLTGSVPGDVIVSSSGNLLMGPAILDKSLKLITANNERLTILPSGNVGIASTNPTERLHVTGNIRFSGALMPNNTAGTAGQVLTSAGAGAVPTWTTLPTATTYTGSTSTILNGTSFERAALTGDVTATQNSNTLTIANDAVTYAKMQNVSANNRILGRATTGAGDVEEITLGSGLTLTGTTLTANGDLRLVNTSSHITQDAGVGSNGSSAGATETILIGQGTGNSNSGGRNIFIGQEAGYSNTTPTEQIFIGYKAGRANTTGTKNTLIGSLSGTSFTTGSNNTAVGHQNLLNNTTGEYNTAVGSGALAYNTSSNNTAIGGSAMVFNTGLANTAIGALAMLNGNSSGSFNTALGSEAGYSLLGNSNTLIGFRAGSNLSSGSKNIIIGESIQAPSNTGNNQLSIGNLIFGTNVDGSGTTISTGNIGIGVAAPSQKLEVAGAIRFSGALMPNNTAGTSGQVLTSAGAGAVPTWTTLPTATTYTGSTSVMLNGTSFERAALTGDVTALQNSNALTIANDAVTSAKILDGTIATADVANSAVTYAKIQNVSANNMLLGRATSGAGDVEEITLGTGLSLSGTTLNATGDLRLVNTSSHITQDAGVGSNGTSSGAAKNIMIGSGAGNANSGADNVFIGHQAGNANTTAPRGVFIGSNAGKSNTSAERNTFVGYNSGQAFTTGGENTALGYQALQNNSTGTSNTAIGSMTLISNGGNNNTALGSNVMPFNTGNSNTAVGALAMLSGNAGDHNTVMGTSAAWQMTGSNNVILGSNSGNNLTTGSRNILIGRNINAPVATGSNQLSIGNLIFGTGVNGDGSTLSTGNIGIGVSSPSEKLEVAGAIRFSGALMPNNTAGTAGQVLTSAGAGAVPTWTTLPTATTYTGSTSTILNGTSFERAALTGDVTATQNSNTLTIANDAVTYAKMQNVSANNRILGRATTGAGDVEEITLGTGLTLTGTTLNATSATTIYSGDGSLSGNRIVTQGTNTLAFTSSATTGTSHFTVDGTTLNVDAVNNRLGVGTAIPTFPLHVVTTDANAGRFEMNSTSSTVGGVSTIELINTNNLIGNYTSIAGKASSGGFSASMEFVNTNGSHLAPIGDIRFVTNNNGTITEKFRILGAGGLRASSLAGTGSRMVIADANGNLSTQTIPTSTTYTGSASVILNGTSFERAALTGDVTASQNSNALTIANDAVTSAKISDGTIATADLANSAVTYAKIQNVSANNRILGRATTGAGTVEEITLGTGLTLTGTTLSASSGSLRLVNSTSHITQDAGVGSNGSSAGAGEVIAIGAGAGNANSAAGSVFIGHNAGQSNTSGSMNTYIGFQSGQSSTNGTENTYLGYQSGKNTTSGVFMNTFIGSRAGLTNTTGVANTALGAKALFNNNSNRNTAVGAEALMASTSGTDNTAVGREAIPQNTTGNGNTALGTAAMFWSSNGSNNTAIGGGAGYQLTTGGNNTFLGSASGSNVTSGSNNISIGANAHLASQTASNQLSIGNLIYGTSLDGTGSTISTGNIGIGVTAPSQKLEVAGAIRFSGALMPNNSAGTAGQVLTSAGAGAVPTWTTISAGTTYSGSTSVILNGTSFERAALTGDVTASQNSNALTIANNAVNSAKIADGAITAAKLNQMSATTGQVMKWNGTAWAAANDENTIADGSETKLTAGTGITISGAGTTASPYVINANSSIATVTANYTSTATNNTILCNVPSGGMTLTLPSASANEGKVIVIRKIDNDRDVLTFSPALNYSTTETISTLNFLKTITVQSNGSSWWIISE